MFGCTRGRCPCMRLLGSRRFSSVAVSAALRGIHTAVQPEITTATREAITSCCAVEISLNRLTFAKLHLDPNISGSIFLDVWDSVPLNLPTGRDFKPHVCAPVAKAAVAHMELHGAIADDVTEFIFRPIHAWRDQKLPVSHKIGLTHQAFILGYVAASFGMAGDLSYALETSDALNAIGSTYPDDSVLTAWTNRPPKEWAHYVSHSLQTYPDFHFDLIPHSKPPHSVHSQTADDMVNMYLHLNTQNALPTFCSASVDRRTRQTIQHLLARCFLACFYHLFARSYSRLT